MFKVFYAFIHPSKTSMFKTWGAWLGKDKEVKDENCSVVNDDLKHDVNKANVMEDADPPPLLQKAKGLSGKP